MGSDVAVRQVPPWCTRKLRWMSGAFGALALLWCGLSAAAYLVLEGTPALPGHVVSARSFTRKGSPELHIEYVFTDEAGREHPDRRDLVAGLARQLGLTTPGAPLTVKVFLGVPLVEGAPNVFAAVPLVFAGECALFALIFFLVDRGEARKSRLALRGRLARGRIDGVSTWSYRGSRSLAVRYHFDGRSGKDRIRVPGGPRFLLELGLDRPPAPGDAIWVAHDAENPEKNTIYSFGEDEKYPAPATALAPSPADLTRETPRALPPGAPRLPTAVWVVTVGFALLVVAGAVLAGVGLAGHEALPALWLVGGFVVSLVAGVVVPLYVDAVLVKRRILRTGAPLPAKVLHVAWIGPKVLSVTFEARTPEGSFRGKERVPRRQLLRMAVEPAVGDTIFLCYRPERPWERAVWGFARPAPPWR